MPFARAFVVIALLLMAGCAASNPANTAAPAPKAATDAERPVERAAVSIREMRTQSEWMDDAIEDAEAVLVFPRYVRIGYFGSVAGAKGVLMVRDKAGFWSGPAFYSLGQLGGGLQIGLEYGSIVYVIRDASLIPDLAQPRWQLDALASVAVITTERGHVVTDMTENLRAVLFTDMDGLFAGVSLDGAYVDLWQTGMEEYHGDGVSGEDVLLAGEGRQGEAQSLVEALLQ